MQDGVQRGEASVFIVKTFYLTISFVTVQRRLIFRVINFKVMSNCRFLDLILRISFCWAAYPSVLRNVLRFGNATEPV